MPLNFDASKKSENELVLEKYVCENKIEEIKNLVASGYDVDHCIKNGVTPLMLACATDAYKSVEALLELGANINAADANGQTPLMYATFKNAVNSAKILLENKEIKLEEKDITGSTALIKSAEYNSVEVLKLLLKAGADINSVNYYGWNTLICSIVKKHDFIAEVLIQEGADINFADKMRRTPLIVAATYDNLSIAEKLIKAGADATIKDVNKNTAFLVAAEKNSANVLKLLIESQEIADEEYDQAVVKCAMKGNVDSLVVLLDKAKNQKEMAFVALTSACLKNNPNIIHVCMDYDCELNNGLHFGMTPLMMACYANADKAAAQLIAYDADINKADEDGVTALMYAASKNTPYLMTLLMRNGAKRSLVDKNGKTFEDYTNIFDKRDFSQFIFERMKSKLPESEKNRKDEIPQKHQSFCERFDWYLQKYWERKPENKQSDIYKDAGISKQTFSKIISNRKPDFRPKKDTVIQLALGLKLTINETEDFLQSAGYAFSEMDKKDVEIKNLFCEQNYKLFDWNDRIYKATGKIFFKALVEEV